MKDSVRKNTGGAGVGAGVAVPGSVPRRDGSEGTPSDAAASRGATGSVRGESGLEEAFVLAYNVKMLRKREKLSKVKFSQMVGISRPFLDKVESGRSDPQLSMIRKLADALGVTTLDLLTPPFEDVSMEGYRKLLV